MVFSVLRRACWRIDSFYPHAGHPIIVQPTGMFVSAPRAKFTQAPSPFDPALMTSLDRNAELFAPECGAWLFGNIPRATWAVSSGATVSADSQDGVGCEIVEDCRKRSCQRRRLGPFVNCREFGLCRERRKCRGNFAQLVKTRQNWKQLVGSHQILLIKHWVISRVPGCLKLE